MAVNFGRGIRLRSGVKVAGDAIAAAAVPDSIVVATTGPGINGEYIWGADAGYFSVGTVTSDYIEGLYLYEQSGNLNSGYTYVVLKDGSYSGSGFNVSGRGIDGDGSTYPRTFTVGGTDYVFQFNGYNYYNSTNILDLKNKIGQTITAKYLPASQPTAPADNTLTPGTYSYYGANYYGCNRDYTDGLVYGMLISSYFNKIEVFVSGSTATEIKLKPGTYTSNSTSFNVTSQGAIDADTNGSARYFNVGGTSVVTTYNGTSYGATGDIFNLVSNYGTPLSAIYDPAAQSSGGGGAGNSTPVMFNSGFLDTYNVGTEYGWRNGLFGNGSFAGYPSNLSGFWYDSTSNETYVDLITGTYSQNINGSGYPTITVITDTTINGYSVLRITDGNNVTATSTSAQNHTGGVRFVFVGDPWGLQAQGSFGYLYINNISYLDDGSGFMPVAYGDINIGSNFQGDSFGWTTEYGSSYIQPTMLDQIYYFSPIGTVVQFISGTYGSIVVDGSALTVGGKDTVTVTIGGVKQSGTLESGGPGPKVVFSGDTFGLQSKNGQTSTVLVVAGTATPAGQVAGGTITVGTDPFNPGGVYGYFPATGAGSSTINPAMVGQIVWFSGGGPSGSTNVRLPSGTYGSVVVDGSLGTVNGETQLTVVVDGISQTGTLYASGSYVELILAGDPYGLQSKNGQTLTVSVIAGAGAGGGRTTYTPSGNWYGGSWMEQGGVQWQVRFFLESSPNSALLARLNSLTNGDLIDITYNGVTETRTITNVGYPPFNGGSSVYITTDTGGNMSWPNIDSIAI